MLLGLIADTHDNMPLIAAAVARFNDAAVDLVLHAGDLIAPFTANEFQKLKSPMIAVFGNNDGEHRMWKERIIGWGEIFENWYETAIAGSSLLLMHEPGHLEEIIESQRYDIIVYGHTHQVDERTVGKTLVVNPGECGGWLTGRSTVALLELPQKKVTLIDV
jgi:putative phosphoesterase